MKSMNKLPLTLLGLLFAFQFVTNSTYAQAWKWGVGSLITNGSGVVDPMGRPLVMGRSGNLYLIANASSMTTNTLQITIGPYVVIDSNNDIYQGTLVCADSNGNYLWALGTQNSIIRFKTIAVDSAENIYVGGSTQSGNIILGDKSLSGVTSFVAKINTSGYVLWIKELAPGLIPASIVVNATGNLYITGYFNDTVVVIGSTSLTNTDPTGATSDVFYGKFDSSLNVKWIKKLGGFGTEYATALSLTNDSEIYILGSFNSDHITLGAYIIYDHSSLSTFFLAKFDTIGNPIWVKNNPNDTNSTINDLALDGDNNAYMVGANYFHEFYFGTDSLSPHDGLILCKYDAAGHEQWLRTSFGFIAGWNIVIDRCDNIWICGKRLNTFLHYPEDAFIMAKYDIYGVQHAALYLNCGGDDNTGLVADNIGNLYLGGDYGGNPMVIADDTLVHNDSSYETIFLAKYWYDSVMCDSIRHTLGATLPLKFTVPVISIFPNPANETCTLTTNSWFSEGSYAEIYDLTGRVIRKFTIFGNTASINVRGIVPGMYQCRVTIINQPPQTMKLSIVD